ncbi:MAG: UvrD-helicase domain-containing protein [Gammaproteobacteria bacterium]|nr:UvrD-helicase domain-containing protein [Gammaproteobacteria bacterium]
MEADVPPGFDLLENTSILIEQAREGFYNEAAINMSGEHARQLESFVSACDGLFNANKSLQSFLDQRSDWWAFTEQQADPCGYANQVLQQQLDIDPDKDFIKEFFSDHLLEDLNQFARLLARHDTRTNLDHADIIAMLLANNTKDEAAFIQLKPAFLTSKNEAMKSRKDSQALRKKLGDDTDTLLELNDIITNKILNTMDLHNRQQTLQLNRLWFSCGQRFIEHYQRLKRELRTLDFTDLEWSTYKLLQNSDNAQWIQYKLDQRINHLLIDEFQDTNSTQWQLILPLLEEMAASEQERPRSVFLVGDEKQSIYSFRRAKPELQSQAADWLEQHLQAQAFPLNKSWRSSNAIIHSVNQVFQQPELQVLLPGFKPHETHLNNLYGRVEVLPLWQKEKQKKDDSIPDELRNPLLEPRPEETGLHYEEGKCIAARIQQLMAQPVMLNEANNARPLSYDDIFILVRKRNHVADYELALRQAGIPFLGANKGTFLDCLEINDMEALLDSLMTPFNNLSIAQVLKSPIFSATDDDLILIASHKTSPQWFIRMEELSELLPAEHTVHYAYTCLQRWRQLADRIPVHDLLDQIYCEADILARYELSSPDSLKPRMRANLVRFLEMALDMDAGRYPSLMRFLEHLRHLKTLNKDAPDEAPMMIASSRVRIMTIHAAKGLEAPVVFLADAISSDKDQASHQTLVEWPVEEQRPTSFQLIPSQTLRNSKSEKYLQYRRQQQEKENANLLYVAITRAKQFLFISACKGRAPNTDWYTPIRTALESIATSQDDDTLVYEWGTAPEVAITQTEDTPAALVTIDPALKQKIKLPELKEKIIAPSHTAKDAIYGGDGDEDAQIRGIVIHRCLDLLTREHPFTEAGIKQLLKTETSYLVTETKLDQWLTEAMTLIDHPDLTDIFQPDNQTKIYNEAPVQYMLDDYLVHGIIDRLLVKDDSIILVDYKTHQQATVDNLKDIADSYTEQMRLYAEGVKQIWPEKKLQTALLFTSCNHLYYLN